MQPMVAGLDTAEALRAPQTTFTVSYPAQRRPAWREALSRGLKRLFDLSCAGAVLLFFLPAFALIALAVTVDSAGPIFFRQRRTGLHGKTFTIYKFRTMRVLEDGADIRHASRDDDRVTRVGRFLRETSLDELPQLLNVLKGDMAMVGPRPHALAHDHHYGALLSAYGARFAVRPGLTGLAQIRGLRGEIRELACMADRVEADVEYAANWSFRHDLWIVMMTVPLLLKRVNAY
jgi:putative colanic acid biosysnthesis UDP-glucose lipid carrier transferase